MPSGLGVPELRGIAQRGRLARQAGEQAAASVEIGRRRRAEQLRLRGEPKLLRPCPFSCRLGVRGRVIRRRIGRPRRRRRLAGQAKPIGRPADGVAQIAAAAHCGHQSQRIAGLRGVRVVDPETTARSACRDRERAAGLAGDRPAPPGSPVPIARRQQVRRQHFHAPGKLPAELAGIEAGRQECSNLPGARIALGHGGCAFAKHRRWCSSCASRSLRIRSAALSWPSSTRMKRRS